MRACGFADLKFFARLRTSAVGLRMMQFVQDKVVELAKRLDQEHACCMGCGYAGPLCPVLIWLDIFCCKIPSTICCPCFDKRVRANMEKACEELSKDMGTLELRVVGGTECYCDVTATGCHPTRWTDLSFVIAPKLAAAAVPAQQTMQSV